MKRRRTLVSVGLVIASMGIITTLAVLLLVERQTTADQHDMVIRLTNEVNDVSMERSRLEVKGQELTQELNHEQRRLADAQSKVNTLVLENEEAAAHIATIEGDLSTTNVHLAERIAEVKGLEDDLSLTVRQLSEATKEHDVLEQTYRLLQVRVGTLTTVERRITDKENAIATLETRSEELATLSPSKKDLSKNTGRTYPHCGSNLET